MRQKLLLMMSAILVVSSLLSACGSPAQPAYSQPAATPSSEAPAPQPEPSEAPQQEPASSEAAQPEVLGPSDDASLATVNVYFYNTDGKEVPMNLVYTEIITPELYFDDVQAAVDGKAIFNFSHVGNTVSFAVYEKSSFEFWFIPQDSSGYPNFNEDIHKTFMKYYCEEGEGGRVFNYKVICDYSDPNNFQPELVEM